MKKPEITKEKIVPLYETKFIKLYDIQYEEGAHYFDATRRPLENIVALKSDDEFKKMLPDAVTAFIIIIPEDGVPRLLLTYEYRYPVGRFLLSPPAGLIDAADLLSEAPMFSAAAREICEETGITPAEISSLKQVSPVCFSTPGMTDESNALVAAIINCKKLPKLSQEGAEGTECFDGFELYNKAEALEILKTSKDRHGNPFSLYTWAALMYFVSDMWKN